MHFKKTLAISAAVIGLSLTARTADAAQKLSQSAPVVLRACATQRVVLFAASRIKV
jgi:hypothetical protein